MALHEIPLLCSHLVYLVFRLVRRQLAVFEYRALAPSVNAAQAGCPHLVPKHKCLGTIWCGCT